MYHTLNPLVNSFFCAVHKKFRSWIFFWIPKNPSVEWRLFFPLGCSFLDMTIKGFFLTVCVCLLVSACAGSSKDASFESGGANTPTKLYRVQKGDSVSKIALKTGTTVPLLARWNNLKPPYTIHPGQTLYLGPPGNDQGPKGVTIERPITQKQDIPPPPTVRRSEKFVWPVRGPLLANFGQKDGGQQNDGINIAADRGTKIRAADGGKVAYVGNEVKGFGNLVLIRHDAQWVTAYAHTDKILVRKGDTVDQNDVIATVGQTGSVTRPQVHFEVRYRGKPVDPMPQLRP
jgi:murein DD-endopeptidase MepM/ murein hydrolase activator NlpD